MQNLTDDSRRRRPAPLCTLALAVVCGLQAAGCGPEAAEPTPDPGPSGAASTEQTDRTNDLGGLTVPEPEVDFGPLIAGEVRTHQFLLRNEGQKTVRVLKVHPECGCTLARLETTEGEEILPQGQSAGRTMSLASLPPGGECYVGIELNTANQRSGPLRKLVTVTSDDPLHSQIDLHLQADLRVPFSIEPFAVTFGTVKQGETPRRTVIVRPADIGPVEIEAFSELPPFLEASHRKVAGEDGESHFELELRVRPDAPARGMSTGQVVARVENAVVREFSFKVLATIQPRIRFDTGDLDNREHVDFGFLPLGQPVTRSIEIFNENESVPYPITAIEVDSRPPGIVEAKLLTLEEGRRYRVELAARFDQATTRSVLGSVTIQSSHPDLPMKRILFAGYLAETK